MSLPVSICSSPPPSFSAAASSLLSHSLLVHKSQSSCYYSFIVDKVASVALIKASPGANHYFICPDTWKMHQWKGEKVTQLARRLVHQAAGRMKKRASPVDLFLSSPQELNHTQQEEEREKVFVAHCSSTLALQEINYSRDKFACGPVDFYLYTHS